MDDGPDDVNRASDAGELSAYEQAFAVVGRVVVVERIDAEAGSDLAGDDAVERVGAGDAAEVQIFE